jgi:hypothetical protein
LPDFKKNRPFNILIPDRKPEYRHLLTFTKNLNVITKNYLRLGLLQVPYWMTINDYVIFLANIFTKENWLATTTQNLVIKTLVELYKSHGVFDGSQNWPRLKEWYQLLSRKLSNEKSFQVKDTYNRLLNRLDPYINSAVFDCRWGIPHDIWRKYNIVIELDEGFSDEMYSFVCSFLAALLLSYNRRQGLVGSQLQTQIVIDEARHLLRERNVSVFGPGAITDPISMGRSYGLGLLFLSQETASFTQLVRSLSYIRIAFPLYDVKDLDYIQGSWGLNRDQRQFMFEMPPKRHAIVRIGNFEDPLYMAVAHFRIKRKWATAEVEQQMGPFYKKLRVESRPVVKPISIQADEAMPSGGARVLSEFLGKYPFTKVSEMQRAGLSSPAEVNKALDSLEKSGFLKREIHRVSKRGRPACFGVLSDKALNYLNIKAPKGKGSFGHKLYVNIINRKIAAKGLKATVEGRIKGSSHACDILVHSAKTGYICIELSLHLQNLISNCRLNFKAGAAKVVIVTKNKADAEKANNMVENDQSLDKYAANIVIHTIDRYFN